MKESTKSVAVAAEAIKHSCVSLMTSVYRADAQVLEGTAPEWYRGQVAASVRGSIEGLLIAARALDSLAETRAAKIEVAALIQFVENELENL